MRILMTITALLAALAPGVAAAQAGPLAAPAAPAVQPNPATPGGRIWVWTGGCTAAGTATSPALSAPIRLSPDHPEGPSGPGTLRADLSGGVYPLTLHCGGTLTATFRVVASGGADPSPEHLGIGDAALGAAVVLGGIAFGTVSLVRRRRAATGR